MSYREEVVSFGEDSKLRGILTLPSARHERPSAGVLIAGAGTIHSAGPNRFHVQIARRLADAGAAVLRFDSAGIGDSDASDSRVSPEERMLKEAKAAIDLLSQRATQRRIAVLGLCSGAVTAFRIALADKAIAGAALINPDTSRVSERLKQHAMVRHYFRTSLLRAESWRRLISGHADYHKLARVPLLVLRQMLPGGTSTHDSALRELRSLPNRGVHVLVVSAEVDASAAYVRLAKSRLSSEALAYLVSEVVPHGDHTLTCKRDREHALQRIDAWYGRLIAMEPVGAEVCKVRVQDVPASR